VAEIYLFRSCLWPERGLEHDKVSLFNFRLIVTKG